MAKATVNEVAKFLKRAVDDLKSGGSGTWHMWLNDYLELDVGFMPGYDNEDSPFNDGYAICAEICVNDDMPDIEWATMPYSEDTGDVWDTCMALDYENENYMKTAKWYIWEAEEIMKAVKSGEYKIPGYKPEYESKKRKMKESLSDSSDEILNKVFDFLDSEYGVRTFDNEDYSEIYDCVADISTVISRAII